MNHIRKVLIANDRIYRKLVMVILAICLALTWVLCDIITINDITNDTLNKSDANQFVLMITSVIGLGLGVVFFFQWILYILYKKLYDLRRIQNINLRFMGLTRRKLLLTYYLDYMSTLVPSVLLGWIVYFLVSNILFSFFDVKWNTGDIYNLFFRGTLYIFVSAFGFGLMLHSSSKKNIIDELDASYNMASNSKENEERSFYFYIRIVSGISLILLLAFIIWKKAEFEKTENLFLLLLIALFLIVLKPMVVTLNRVMLKAFEHTQLKYIWLSFLFDTFSIKRKILMMRFIIIGITIFFGLNLLFANVRSTAGELVNRNINYVFYKAYPSHQIASDENTANIATGSYYKIRYNNSNLNILGIESVYLRHFEDVDVEDELVEKFSTEQNIMILPDYYINQNDIGEEIAVEIEGEKVTFKVASGYRNNDLSRLTGFVSKKYLNKKMGLDETAFNVKFYLKEEIQKNIFEGETVSKEDIRENSIQKSVQGTDLVEIISWLVLFSMGIFYLYFLSLDVESFTGDIVRLKLIGVDDLGIYISYIAKIIINIVFSVFFAFLSSIIFAKSLAYTMLGTQYFVGAFFFNIKLFAFIVAFIVILSLITVILMIKKVIEGEFLFFVSTK